MGDYAEPRAAVACVLLLDVCSAMRSAV